MPDWLLWMGLGALAIVAIIVVIGYLVLWYLTRNCKVGIL